MTRHNNILCIMALGLVAALYLCGCNDSYPELMREEEDTPKEIISKENIKAPIIPSMSDPQYDIITRGMGAMGQNDKEKWASARFRTFALLSETKYSLPDANGRTNYTVAESDTTHKLLWNQPMGIVDNESEKRVKFFNKVDENTEETKWYHSAYQNWKYKFATYFADGAEVANTLKGNSDNTVTVNFELDGSQDVMHAFAYHTEEELDNALSNLNAEHDKPLHEDRELLLYSTMAGHRSINPKFRINHLLTEINLRIKGAKGDKGQSTSFNQVSVRKVVLESRYKGNLKVLDDKWTEESYNREVENGQILTFSGEKTEFEAEIIPNCEEYKNSVLHDSNYEDGYLDTLHHHILSETSSEELTKSLLVVPSDEYMLTITYDLLIENNGKHRFGIGSIPYNIKPPTGHEKFEAGHAYTVVVTVYGPQEGDGTVTLKSWIGDNAPIGDIDNEIIDINNE